MIKLKALIKEPGSFFKKSRGRWVFELGNPLLKGIFYSSENHSLIEKVVAETLPPEKARESIRSFFLKTAQSPEGACPLWVLIARNMSTFRSFELPSTDPKELEAMVDLQIGKQTPYSREEIVTDWNVRPASRAGFSRINLAIVHRSLFADYFETLRDLGFEVERVGLVSSGLVNFSSPAAVSEILLDISGYYTEFEIISQGQFLFSRALPVGEAKLEENPQESLEKFFQEFKRSLEIVQHEQVISPLPNQVLLLGASQNLEQIKERLIREFSMECRVAPPEGSLFKFSPGALEEWQKIRGKDSFYGILGGVAVDPAHHLNLMPPELKLRKTLEDRMRELVRFGVLVGFFIILLSGLFLERIYKKTVSVEKLEEQYQKTASEAQQVEQMRKVLELAQGRTAEGSALNFLEILLKSTPPDLYYSNIQYEEGKSVSLKGYAKGMSAVFDFATELDKQGKFQNVETKYATKRRIKDEELIEFEIIGGLVK